LSFIAKLFLGIIDFENMCDSRVSLLNTKIAVVNR
jgi:hypothetical protein